MSNGADHYKILGVAPNASAAEIRRAYRQLALKFHPDRNRSPDAAATFAKIADSYRVLSNPLLKSEYDESRQPNSQSHQSTPHYSSDYARRRDGTPTAPVAPSIAILPDLLSRVTHPSVVAAIVLLILGFCALFYNWLWSQHQFSSTSGDWSHAYMVPFICVYLLWQHREGLARVRVQTFWPGLVPLLLGVVSYVYFIVGVPNHMGQGFALVLAVFGVVLLITGPRVMDFAFLPVAYLLFAITISERIMIEVTFRLQQWAATGAYIVLNAVGVQTDLKGNVLEVLKNDGTVEALNVAEACSGMRMVIAFVALGAAMALVATRMWWKRVILLAMSIPLALALNVVRVVVLGIAALYNSNLASGQAHTFIGTVLLVPGFLIYLGLVWTLNKAVAESKESDGVTDSLPAPKPAAGGAVA